MTKSQLQVVPTTFKTMRSSWEENKNTQNKTLEIKLFSRAVVTLHAQRPEAHLMLKRHGVSLRGALKTPEPLALNGLLRRFPLLQLSKWTLAHKAPCLPAPKWSPSTPTRKGPLLRRKHPLSGCHVPLKQVPFILRLTRETVELLLNWGW